MMKGIENFQWPLHIYKYSYRNNNLFRNVPQKKYDQVCGEHFNKPGHSQLDMLPVILEEVTHKNDDFLRLRREELWIREYQLIEFGANKHS